MTVNPAGRLSEPSIGGDGSGTDLAAVFGARLDVAIAYAEILRTVAVERGLMGPREGDRVWDRHLVNSMATADLIPEGAHVVDVGSGAGLPGLVLAIARPDLRMSLVEPLLRRATFLSETVTELGVQDQVEVVRGRAEEPGVASVVGAADVVVSRALAPLAKVMAWCVPLARVGGAVLAMKGSSAQDELDRDRAAVMRLGISVPELVECRVGAGQNPTWVVRAVRVSARPSRRPR